HPCVIRDYCCTSATVAHTVAAAATTRLYRSFLHTLPSIAQRVLIVQASFSCSRSTAPSLDVSAFEWAEAAVNSWLAGAQKGETLLAKPNAATGPSRRRRRFEWNSSRRIPGGGQSRRSEVDRTDVGSASDSASNAGTSHLLSCGG